MIGGSHDDPPSEQGNVNARAGPVVVRRPKPVPARATPNNASSSPKTATIQGEIHDPSVFHSQKTGKHGRIKNKDTPDSSPRRAYSDERGEPTKEEAQQATAAREPLLDPQPTKEVSYLKGGLGGLLPSLVG